MNVPTQKCFVSLKDHKENFVNDPKCRLLNPTKIEIAKVSEQILIREVFIRKKKSCEFSQTGGILTFSQLFLCIL